MGDSITQCDLFKKLGINSSDQWVFYDKRFEKFFNFCAENLSVDENLLTEHEVLERYELLRRGEFLDFSERQKRLQQIELEYPGLPGSTDAEVLRIEQDLAALQRKEEDYAMLVEDMSCIKNQINLRLGKLEDDLNAELCVEKDLLALCRTKCRNLEELQRENLQLSNDATKCFTITQSPPLFMHQLPMDQYFLKCDSFMQYFTLYMRENFKIQQYIGEQNGNTQEIVDSLNSLANSINNYTRKYIKEKVNAKATESLFDLLDLRQFKGLSLSEMEAQTRELEQFNEHHLNSVYETHLNNLMRLVQQRTHQRMELILYENTKQKVERAQKRYEAVKCLANLISDALSNAELIWITMQLDLEKKIKRFNSTKNLSVATRACVKRLKAMQQLNGTASTMCGEFVLKLAELLNSHTERLNVRNDIKSCLYEYEKFCRLLAYAEQGLWNKKSYASAQAQLDELSREEHLLHQLVYDGPVKAPMFVQLRFLQAIFQAKTNQQRIDTTLQRLRKQFQEINERMKNDKLWRYRQLLWIWFLTEPKRMLMAIEEVKKTAEKVPAISKIKSLGGIRRK